MLLNPDARDPIPHALALHTSDSIIQRFDDKLISVIRCVVLGVLHQDRETVTAWLLQHQGFGFDSG